MLLFMLKNCILNVFLGAAAKPYINTAKGVYSLLTWSSPPYTLIVFVVSAVISVPHHYHFFTMYSHCLCCECSYTLFLTMYSNCLCCECCYHSLCTLTVCVVSGVIYSSPCTCFVFVVSAVIDSSPCTITLF